MEAGTLRGVNWTEGCDWGDKQIHKHMFGFWFTSCRKRLILHITLYISVGWFALQFFTKLKWQLRLVRISIEGRLGQELRYSCEISSCETSLEERRMFKTCTWYGCGRIRGWFDNIQYRQYSSSKISNKIFPILAIFERFVKIQAFPLTFLLHYLGFAHFWGWWKPS